VNSPVISDSAACASRKLLGNSSSCAADSRAAARCRAAGQGGRGWRARRHECACRPAACQPPLQAALSATGSIPARSLGRQPDFVAHHPRRLGVTSILLLWMSAAPPAGRRVAESPTHARPVAGAAVNQQQAPRSALVHRGPGAGDPIFSRVLGLGNRRYRSGAAAPPRSGMVFAHGVACGAGDLVTIAASIRPADSRGFDCRRSV